MSAKENQEFKDALRDISSHTHELQCPFSRVRTAEWARKLANMPDDTLESCKLRNEYAQMLRIQVRNNILHGPFSCPPPDGDLVGLSECLGNLICKQVSKDTAFLLKTCNRNPILSQRILLSYKEDKSQRDQIELLISKQIDFRQVSSPNLILEVPLLPRSGPIQPIINHKSPDGRAYVTVKQIPGGGVFCYMAVSPDGLGCNLKS